MLYCSKVAVLAVLGAPLIGAQLLPACITNALSSGSIAMPASCNAVDYKCLCADSSFVASLVPAAKAACSATELTSALSAAQALCGGLGVTINIDASAITASTSVPGPVSSSTSATLLAPPIAYASSSAPVQASTSIFAAGSGKASSVFTASVATLSTITSVSSQAGTIPSAVSQLGDGQPLAPTGKYNVSSNLSATSTPCTTITPFTGSASRYGLQHLSFGMFLGACWVFFAL